MERPADAWAAMRQPPWRFLCSGWPLRSWSYLAGSALLGLAFLCSTLLLLATGMVTAPILLGIPLLLSLPMLPTALARIERRRLARIQPGAGVLPEARPPATGGPLTRWQQRRRELPTARELGYAVLLALPLWLADLVVVANTLLFLVVLAAAPALASADAVALGPWTLTSAWQAVPFTLVGLPVLWLVGSYLVTALAGAQAALARLLLASSEEELARRVSELNRSRLHLVDAFEVERQRIERDLHDGVQQRLVALSMTLGSADYELEDGPARDLVRAAQTQAEEALADLRATLRGIHPRVLVDRGLEAAVREIADRLPFSVAVDLATVERATGPAEAAAYFVVSEALTNVVRHADAQRAQVAGTRAGGWLELAVSDDGRGGADPAAGSGLTGLAHRLAALGGTLTVSSPPGGPTEVRMRCPWPSR